MGLYAFRLPDKLIEEVDRVAKAVETDRPGSRITRPEIVRMLLVEALEARKPGRR